MARQTSWTIAMVLALWGCKADELDIGRDQTAGTDAASDTTGAGGVSGASGGMPGTGGSVPSTGDGVPGSGGSVSGTGKVSGAGGAAPWSAVCGDGVVAGDESCDDGNDVSFDGCNALCQIESSFRCDAWGMPCILEQLCGDGLIDPAEVCDDGNTDSGDGCSSDCSAVESGHHCPTPGSACRPLCGDGIVSVGEACDCGTGAAPLPAGCSATNGILMDDGTGCTSTCQHEPTCIDGGGDSQCLAICGDGIVQPAEECDSGPLNDDATYGGCGTQCKLGPSCGDGVVNGPEECDLGADNGNHATGKDGCTLACTKVHYCGDGIADGMMGEECDLGIENGNTGSRCTRDCQIAR